MTENKEEVGRILALVEEGKLKPEDADRLLASLEGRRQTIRCPYCAESIPAGREVCPECATPLSTAQPTVPSRRTGSTSGFSGLSTLGKFLVIYTFLATGLILLTSIGFNGSLATLVQAGLAVLGFAAGVLLCRGHAAGWGLGMLWAGLQIVAVVVNGQLLNRQLLSFHFITTANGSGLGINAVGILLLVLFVVAARQHREPLNAPHGARYVREAP